MAVIGATNAQTPQPPKAVPEAPAMGGEPNTKPGPQPIALRANEVKLSGLANAGLVHITKEQLGQLSEVLYPNSAKQTAQVPQNIGTVTTALLDPARHAITFIGVSAKGKVMAVSWSEVQPINQPHDEFATALTAQQIASAPAFDETSRNVIDVEKALVGRPIRTADGKQAGTLSDLVFEVKSGKVDYAVVSQGGVHLGTNNGPYAVPWAKIKSVSGGKTQPITLTLNDQQFAALPIFGASKAQETPGTRAASAKVGATEQPPP
ncbi:MAG TPA: PRC-barrel domain-containing protein [Stellaceae bacterium]